MQDNRKPRAGHKVLDERFVVTEGLSLQHASNQNNAVFRIKIFHQRVKHG